MLVFPNCKINLGLNILAKREDNYHNLESVFYPINWCDALELLPGSGNKGELELIQHGLFEGMNSSDNLLVKVWQQLNTEIKLPPLKVHLYKNIPIGAGLGGGSSDVAFFIQHLDRYFELGLSRPHQLTLASTIGSDCAFFIQNTVQFATGKGDILKPVHLDLSAYYILLVYPNIHCSTAEAYAGVAPKIPNYNLLNTVENTAIENWREMVKNDFEKNIFAKYPAIGQIKSDLYKMGALYASMSGSGSTVFGIFKSQPDLQVFSAFNCHLQNPATVLS